MLKTNEQDLRSSEDLRFLPLSDVMGAEVAGADLRVRDGDSNDRSHAVGRHRDRHRVFAFHVAAECRVLLHVPGLLAIGKVDAVGGQACRPHPGGHAGAAPNSRQIAKTTAADPAGNGQSAPFQGLDAD